MIGWPALHDNAFIYNMLTVIGWPVLHDNAFIYNTIAVIGWRALHDDTFIYATLAVIGWPVLRDRDWMNVQWRAVKVGDIVKVVDHQFFPADLVLLSSRSDLISYALYCDLDFCFF